MIALLTNLDRPKSKSRFLGIREWFPQCALVLVCLSMVFFGSPSATQGQEEVVAGIVPTQLEPQPSTQRYRLRIVWGGGAATPWQGSLVMSSGRFEAITTLGFESDSGASLNANGNELKITPVRRADFGGFDIDIVGSQTNELLLTLLAPELGVGIERQVVDLSPLLEPTRQNESLQIPLDDSGNRLDINRAPGDRLPVVISREHMIFEPGEEFEFDLRPFSGTSDSHFRSNLQIEVFGEDPSQAEFEGTFPLNRQGGFFRTEAPIRFPVPEREGVYEVRVTLRDETLVTRLNFNRQKLSRTMQLVVVEQGTIDPLQQLEEIVLWNEVFNSDETRSVWLDRIPGVPQIRNASSGSATNTLHNEGVTSENVEGKNWLRFAPGGWQAIPLQIEELGKPHIIEVEFLDEGPMAVGVSVLQPDAAGQVEPFGIDSGISIRKTLGAAAPVIRRHRIFFWPEHEKPYLLFANRHAEASASIGTIRVLAGPDALAAAMDAEEVLGEKPVSGRRQFVSFYEKPLFAENFAAPKAFDGSTGQSWHDWNTFLTGAKRWTQYLKANGYSAAMVVVAGDGSALYPSRLLQPNPRYDSGVFSPSGTDPMRKDVVEMLLRVFAREGLQLVPVFHFNAPLPALEQQRLVAGDAANGITLFDLQGDSRIPTLRDASSSVSIYNPLDRRVQTAWSDVMREFMNRYQGHGTSLGGVGFLYSKDALQVLPGQSWGSDPFTLQRFQQDMEWAKDEDVDWFARLLNSENRDAWLSWRQTQMSNWMSELQEICQTSGPVYLLGGNLFETQDAFSALAPSLRRSGDMPDALARIGIPVQRIAEDPNLVFLQPGELSPEKSLAENRLNIQLNQTGEVTRLFREFENSGMLFSHRYAWAEFEQLKNRRMFGKVQQQAPMRLQPLTPVGAWNREHLARSIADHDSQFLVEGGWLTGFGQEEHLLPLVEVFTQLPNVRFLDVPFDEATQPQVGVIMRQVIVGDQNWFYAVNPTPWPLTCRMQLSGRNTILESVSGEFRFEDSAQPEVLMELEPFSLQAGFTQADVNVTGYEVVVPPEVTSNLQDRLNSLLPKVSQAAQAEPVPFLDNPGFEPIGTGPEGPQKFGWSYDNRVQEAISLKQENVLQGKTCLTMVSDGEPTWVRSNKFSVPETGRLSVSVMIRSDDPDAQPPLRISLLGDDGRHIYYRYGSIVGQSRKISQEWQEFAVHFDDLPLNQTQGELQIGFDLMAAGHVDIDRVRLFDRWLDGQDSRALTQLLALAGYQLSDKQNVDRCRRILEGYWPRFLEEFFPEPGSETGVPEATSTNRSAQVPQSPAKTDESVSPKR